MFSNIFLIEDHVLNSNYDVSTNDQKNCFLNHRVFFKRNWLIHYLLFRKLNIFFESNEYNTKVCSFDKTYEIRVDDINCRWNDNRECHFCFVRKDIAWIIIYEWIDDSTRLLYELMINLLLSIDEYFKFNQWQMIFLNVKIVFIHIWNASWYAESMHRWLILNFAHDIEKSLIVEILDLTIMIFDVLLICFYFYSVWDIDCQRSRSRSHFETEMIEREIINSMCIKCVDVWHKYCFESFKFSLNLMYRIRLFEIDARVHIFRFILKLKFDLFDHSFSAKINDQWSNKYV